MQRSPANELPPGGHTPVGGHGRRPDPDSRPGGQDPTVLRPLPADDPSGHRPERGQGEPSPPNSTGGRASEGGGERATVARALRLAGGIAAGERAGLVDRLSALDAQLARYAAGAVDMELSVKSRGARGQRLTLECWIAGRPRLVAMSDERDLGVAVMRVREGLRRQLDDGATRREPKNNRRLRRSRADSVEPAGGDAGDGRELPSPGGAEPPPVRRSRQRPARTTPPGPR